MYNGQNYVFDFCIYFCDLYIVFNNFFGFVLNFNLVVNIFIGNWNCGGEMYSGNIYFVNFIDWVDGCFIMFVGYSFICFEIMNVGVGFGNVIFIFKDYYVGYQVGINVCILLWLCGFVVVGIFEQVEVSISDILGCFLKNFEVQNFLLEFGFKVDWLDGCFFV